MKKNSFINRIRRLGIGEAICQMLGIQSVKLPQPNVKKVSFQGDVKTKPNPIKKKSFVVRLLHLGHKRYCGHSNKNV